MKPGDAIDVQLEGPGIGRQVHIVMPDGGDRTLEQTPSADAASVRFTDTEQPGQYRLRVIEPRAAAVHAPLCGPPAHR